MFFVAKQQATLFPIKIFDILFHVYRVRTPIGYICDVLIVQTLILQGKSRYL